MQNSDSDVIRAARDYIASGRWWKGSARGGDGGQSVCAVTALANASHIADLSANDEYRVINFVEQFAPAKDTTSLRALAAFNDRPSTTREDVVNVFNKALAELGEL